MHSQNKRGKKVILCTYSPQNDNQITEFVKYTFDSHLDVSVTYTFYIQTFKL